MTEITPYKTDEVFQQHAISRAIHTLPLYLRRLVLVGMDKINMDESMEVSFSVHDALEALDLGQESYTRQALRSSCENALSQFVKVDERESKGIWTGYAWFSFIRIDSNTDTVTMKFNPDLKPYLQAQTAPFSKIMVSDFGKLTSEYSQKLFELVNSRASQADKNGCFFLKYPVDEMRLLLNVPTGKYPRPANFRQCVLDVSIKIINDAEIGYRISCDTIKNGKFIRSFMFHCQVVKKGSLKNVTPATETEKSDDEIRAKYSKEYEVACKNIRAQIHMFGNPNDDEIDTIALKEIRANHPTPKKPKKS